jgi:hypothetical protein
MGVASYRSSDVDAVVAATALARIGEARYVLAGPGSPSYALRNWAGGPIPSALGAKLADGGIVTLASAAALTAGIVTIPVYEIYKVGAEPRWLVGLDLLGPATGLRAAIVPHYDNAEGGNHDTRFSYIGERRLRILERALPPGVFILGVDGHTGLVLDLDDRTATVFGLGGVTVRVAGRGRIFPSGTATTIEALADAARDLGGRGQEDAAVGPGIDNLDPLTRLVDGTSVHEGGVRHHNMAHLEGAFADALVERDVPAAVGAWLALDAAIEERVSAGDRGPELEAARATSRSLIVRLGEVAAVGARDPRQAVAPYVETLLELRSRARAAQDWSTADLLRKRLTAAGVEVRDDEAGSTWTLVEREDR